MATSSSAICGAKSRKPVHVSTQLDKLKLVKTLLHDITPLAKVLQEVVVSFLRGAKTLFVSDCQLQAVLVIDLCGANAARVFAGKLDECKHADGQALEARFNEPDCLAFDSASQTLLVGEEHSLRRISLDGMVSTLCGGETGYREGAGSDAHFNYIGGCVVIGTDAIVADSCNDCLRRVPLDGSSTSLFVGCPHHSGFADGVGTDARFQAPLAITVDKEGNIIVTDCCNNRIRKVTPAGVVSTLAGSGEQGCEDGSAEEAAFNSPQDVACDGQGRVLVADFDNSLIRAVDLHTGCVSTVVEVTEPAAIAVDRWTGEVYVGCLAGIVRFSADFSRMETLHEAKNDFRGIVLL